MDRSQAICEELESLGLDRPVERLDSGVAITAGANLHVVFHTAEPGDREELVKRIGTEATDAVANLPEHEAICFDTFTRNWIQINFRGGIGLLETA
jgi:hypothetical protein